MRVHACRSKPTAVLFQNAASRRYFGHLASTADGALHTIGGDAQQPPPIDGRQSVRVESLELARATAGSVGTTAAAAELRAAHQGMLAALFCLSPEMLEQALVSVRACQLSERGEGAPRR